LPTSAVKETPDTAVVTPEVEAGEEEGEEARVLFEQVEEEN
jgi:hypothetical protein